MAEYHVENFGCRASRSDGEIIGAELRQRGLTAAPGAFQADVVVANTCSVTVQADRTARAFLRRVQRENPKARIVVTGCYVQRAPQEVAALPGVRAVIGNSHKSLISSVVSDIVSNVTEQVVPLAALLVDDRFAHSELSMPQAGWWTEGGPTRPSLKVQDGCGNRCSFCIIPVTRGHSRSLSLASSLSQVQDFVAGGGVELVLSGINLGRWGSDLAPQRTLDELVSTILRETTLPRLRLSSIEPMDWTPQLLALFANQPRLARHAHLPLQSGSDTILRAMHRRYRPWHYAEKLRLIRQCMPDAAIGADVMVGFPGETDLLFEESFTFIKAQPLTYLHLFPFSARPGTRAWYLAQQSPVPARVVGERMARLRELMAEMNRNFRASFVGRILPAVTLQTKTTALTDNFLEVALDQCVEANRNVAVKVTGLTEKGVFGRLEEMLCFI